MVCSIPHLRLVREKNASSTISFLQSVSPLWTTTQRQLRANSLSGCFRTPSGGQTHQSKGPLCSTNWRFQSQGEIANFHQPFCPKRWRSLKSTTPLGSQIGRAHV